MKSVRAAMLAMLLAAPATSALAGVFVPAQKGIETVPGQYVVSFEDDIASPKAAFEAALTSEVERESGEIREIWRSAIHGAAISGISEAQARSLAALPGVAIVTPNAIGYSSTTQINAPEQLDRIDQRNLPLNSTYTYAYTGSGVHAYVMDGGIRTTHDDFAHAPGIRVQASNDFDAVGGSPCSPGQEGWDHGTLVASVIGGAYGGVAKGVRIHGIRVSDCLVGATTLQSMLSGTNWVYAHGVKPAVVNYSTFVADAGGQFQTAVANLIAAGFFVTSAAGNNGPADDCGTPPNTVSGVFVVAGSNTSDQQDPQSSCGACVAGYALVFARGAGSASDTAIIYRGGTSFSAPAAAGAAALLYQSAAPYVPTPAEMYAKLRANASQVVTGTCGVGPGRLIYTGLPW